MNLTEQARQLMALRRPHLANGALIILPLTAAASMASAQTAVFGQPTTFNAGGGEINTSASTTQVISNNGHSLKIYGTGSIMGDGSGGNFTAFFDWSGNWITPPTVGDLFSALENATISIGSGPVSNLRATYTIDLNNDNTPELTVNATGSGPNPSTITFANSNSFSAPSSNASSYFIELQVQGSIPVGSQSVININIPQSSFDLAAVPEPSASLLLVLAAMVALARIGWRKLSRRARA